MNTSGKLDAWRPRTLHRAASLKFLKAIDNKLRVGTPWDGIAALVPDGSEQWLPENWRTWPHLSLCIDQGSDGLCPAHCMKYKLLANIDDWYCFSHGVHNDMNLRDQRCNVFNLKLIMLILLNLPHGPEKEEGMRYEQMCGCMRWYFEKFSPDTSELFKARVADMHTELSNAGLLDAASGASQEDTVWNWLKERWASPKKGHRVKLCEFMRLHRCLQDVVQTWTVLLFEREVLGLEEDFLSGSAFKVKMGITAAQAQEAADLRTTGAAAAQNLDAKILRSCSANAVAVSVVVLSSSTNRRVVSIMQCSGEPMCRWEGTESKECRNAATAHAWFLGQLSSDFGASLQQVFATLVDQTVVRTCGFLAHQGEPVEDQLQMQASEDEFASLHGSLCLALMSHRVRRTYFKFSGWPGKCFRLCLPGAVAPASDTIGNFKADKEAFDQLSALQEKPPDIVAMLARSPFHCTVNRQWSAAFASTNWEPHPDFVALASERSNCWMNSELPENIFNTAKNSKQVKGTKRFRKPERAMAMSLARNTIENQFRFSVVPSDVSMPRRSFVLGHEAFGKKDRPATFPTDGIATYTQKASFFSPKAENVGLPTADLTVVREVTRYNTTAAARDADLGAIGSWEHKLVIRRVGSTTATDFGWHLPLHHYKKSAVVCLPVVLQNIPEYPGKQYVELAHGTLDVHTFAILDWSCVTGVTFEWMSWCTFEHSFPNAKAHLRAGTRAVVALEEQPVKTIAARCAFWMLGPAVVNIIASHLRVAMDGCSTSTEKLLRLIQEVLECSEGDALHILQKRLPGYDVQDDFTDEFLLLDEALACLAKGDEDQVKSAQAKDRTRRSAYETFVCEFRQCKAAYRERNPPAEPALATAVKAKGRPKRAKAAEAASCVPYRFPEEFTNLEQAEVKRYLPAGAYIWKDRTHGVWHTRLPPFKENRSKKADSDHAALSRVLSIVWRQWCDANGVEYTACPMHDIDWASVGV